MSGDESVRAFLRGAPFGVLLLDAHGKILSCTGSLGGNGYASLEGRNILEFVSPAEARRAAVALADAAVSPGLAHTIELPLRFAAQAASAWFLVSFVPVRDSDDGARVAALATDITAQKEELARLQRTERMLVESQHTAQFGTWEWDPSEPEASWSAELFRIYGLDAETHRPSYQDYLTRVHPEDRERVRRATDEAFHHKKGYSHDERVFRPGGEIRYLHTWAQPVVDERGKLIRVFGVCQDVTDHKRVELERDELLERERKARTAAEEAVARSAVVLRVSRTLVEGSADSEEVRHAALSVCTRWWVDWAVLYVSREDALSPTVAHREHPREAWARAVLHRNPVWPVPEDAPFGPGRVAKTGELEFLPELRSPPPVGDPLVDASPAAGQPITSYLCLPLSVGERTRGALMLARTLARPNAAPLTEADRELAQEVAFRFAAAIDRAELRRRADEAVRVRDEFLSVASHELRTPLTTMKIQLEAVLRRLRSGIQLPVEVLEQIAVRGLRQVNRLAQLTEQLLEVSRLREGIELSTERADLAHLVESAVRPYERNAEREGSRFELNLRPGIAGEWDRDRIRQVVAHLVCNALKYGAGRPIEVSVEPTPQGGRVTVSDHGIGVAPEHVERIFGQFERAVSSRHFGGLGLGLYLARRVVEAHGGHIEVESRPGEGATFVVELPSSPPGAALAPRDLVTPASPV